MAIEKNFPNIKPNSRSYSPGNYPQVEFEAQNGVKTVIRYGKNRTGASLTLGFNNISDQEAALILENYEDVNAAWNYVTFKAENGVSGISNTTNLEPSIAGQSNPVSSLQSLVKEAGSGLKWRYDGPPEVTSVFHGRSNVQCKFVACLDSP